MMTIGRPLGGEDGPVSPLNYKRAVVKPAPREFTVEVLCPTKQGNHFSYGVRVCPVVRSGGSSDSRSTSSYAEYDIWRRWEDCLDFQETLEDEYSKLSRQKVKVLKRWASGKKRPEEMDGPYHSRNAAASFESLPEGPDPREVAMDVHKLVPPLSRKGSLFRVGRSTLKQREDEFAAMIQALFNPSPDAPVLLQELRNCSSIRDFFAFWRRDKDLSKKAGKDVPRLRRSNHSMSSLSNFSFMSSSTTPSSPAVPVFPRATSPAAFLRHSMFTRTMTDLHGEAIPSPSSAPPATGQFVPDTTTTLTQSGSSHEHRPMAATEAPPGSMMFTDELLLNDEPATIVPPVPQFPRHLAVREIQSRISHSPSIRVPYQIPEDDLDSLPRPQARPKRDSSIAPSYRNARIFIPAPSSELGIAEQSPQYSPVDQHPDTSPSAPPPTQRTLHNASVFPISPQSSSRSRSISSVPSSLSVNRLSVTSSISSYIQASWRSSTHGSECSDDSESCFDPDITFLNSPAIPHTPLSQIAETYDFDPGHRSRTSASSFASIRTEASADGVLPRHMHPYVDSPRIHGLSLPPDDRKQSPIEPISEGGEEPSDVYFTDHAEGARFSMENLDKQLPPIFGHKGKDSISSVGSVNSTDSASDPQALWSPRNDAFVVKAVYNESVVVFRAERTMCLVTIRQRIKERFALHENVPLDEGFLLGYLPARTATNGVGRMGRSNSVNSTVSDVSHLRMLQTEADWQAAMVASSGKLTLRVLDPEPCF